MGIKYFKVYISEEDDKQMFIADVYRNIKVSRCIIFLNKKKDASTLKYILKHLGIETLELKGGISDQERDNMID